MSETDLWCVDGDEQPFDAPLLSVLDNALGRLTVPVDIPTHKTDSSMSNHIY